MLLVVFVVLLVVSLVDPDWYVFVVSDEYPPEMVVLLPDVFVCEFVVAPEFVTSAIDVDVIMPKNIRQNIAIIFLFNIACPSSRFLALLDVFIKKCKNFYTSGYLKVLKISFMS